MPFKLKSSNPSDPGANNPNQSKFEAYIDKRNALQKALNEEKTRVENIKNNAGSLMKELYEQDQETGYDHFSLMEDPEKRLPSTGVVSDVLYNYMKKNNLASCNTMACSIMKEANVTVPDSVGEEGLIINEETYYPGDPMPIVPGNIQFDYLSSQLGFEMQPIGTIPDQPMDLIRAGRFAPDTNNPENIITSHSVLSGGLKENDPDNDGTPYSFYNSAKIEQGLTRSEYYTKPEKYAPGYESDTMLLNPGIKGNRVMRYVGNIPEKEKKLRELKIVSPPMPEPAGVQSVMPNITPMNMMLKRRR